MQGHSRAETSRDMRCRPSNHLCRSEYRRRVSESSTWEPLAARHQPSGEIPGGQRGKRSGHLTCTCASPACPRGLLGGK